MPPLPTSARRNAVPYNPIEPHAESHELNGDDPVLGTVRLLDLVELSSTSTYDFTATLAAGWQDVTPLTTTVRTRGGTLRITFGGSRTIHSDITTGNADVSYNLRVVVGSSNLVSYSWAQLLPTSGLGVFAEFSETWTWFTTPVAGEYTIKLQVDAPYLDGQVYISGLGTYSAETPGCYFQIEELLPVRRG